MILQVLADGLASGAMIGLGAIGVTLTYSILRFANFAHGEFLTFGAYSTLLVASAIGGFLGGSTAAIGPFSFGWNVIAAGLAGLVLTGLLALALDAILFRKLGAGAASISVVMASFGASMALRSLIEFAFSSRPAYFTREMQIAVPIGPEVRLTPDRMAVAGLAIAIMVVMHLLMTRTQTGRAMRAVSENPALARVAGVDVAAVVRMTWLLGGALAAAAGIMLGLLVQIRPFMGFDMLLPLFAAAILGGIGSLPGALAGALIVGVGEAATVAYIGAEWRAAVAFLVLVAVLLVRPAGLFGRRD